MENQEFFVDEILQTAIFLGKPDEQKQSHRALFQSWMPDLYLLRARGFSWMQLAELLAKAEINLRPGTVKSYYYAALPECEVLCREKSADQLLLLKEIREKARAATMKSLIERISSVVPAAVSPPDRVEIKKTGPCPAPALAVAPAMVQPVPKNLPVAAVLETNTLGNGSDQTVEAVMPAPMPAPKLRCLPIELGIREFTRNKGISLDMYEPGDLEHTAVPGVMLSLEQRLTSATLEFINDATGEIRQENRNEKRFRTLWSVPIPPTIFKSSVDFVVMNESLFKHRTAEREAENKKKSQL